MRDQTVTLLRMRYVARKAFLDTLREYAAPLSWLGRVLTRIANRIAEGKRAGPKAPDHVPGA